MSRALLFHAYTMYCLFSMRYSYFFFNNRRRCRRRRRRRPHHHHHHHHHHPHHHDNTHDINDCNNNDHSHN